MDPHLITEARERGWTVLADEARTARELALFYDPDGDYAGPIFDDRTGAETAELTAADLLAITAMQVQASPRALGRFLRDDATRAELRESLVRLTPRAVVTTILVMTTTSLADAKQHLSRYVQSAEDTHERTVITKNGRPVAALISIDDLESMEETLAIMSDPQLMAGIRESLDQIERGEVIPGEEVLTEFNRRHGRE